MHDNNINKSNSQSKAVSLLKNSSTFVTNKPYLKEILNTVCCIVFCILKHCKHSLMYSFLYFNAL